jgi:predicted Zn finger-like uncharacterized protein
MQPQEHLHQYKMVPHKTRRDLYMCINPHCTHRTQKQYLEGKAAECPICHNEFVISKAQLNKGRRVLKCDACKTRKHFGGRVIKPTIAISAEDLLKQAEELS